MLVYKTVEPHLITNNFRTTHKTANNETCGKPNKCRSRPPTKQVTQGTVLQAGARARAAANCTTRKVGTNETRLCRWGPRDHGHTETQPSDSPPLTDSSMTHRHRWQPDGSSADGVPGVFVWCARIIENVERETERDETSRVSCSAVLAQGQRTPCAEAWFECGIYGGQSATPPDVSTSAFMSPTLWT